MPVARATEQGLIQRYSTVDESLPGLRGTLLASEQMARHYRMPVPVAVEYDDFTVDLSAHPADLLTQVGRLADGIATPHTGP